VPAILFVDGGALVPFVQLAVALRRWGYRTIRVTTAQRSIGSSYTRRLAFDRIVYLDRAALVDLDRILSDEQIIDVHCSEPVAVDVYRALERGAGKSDAGGWHHRTELVDKWNVVALLDRADITHPNVVLGRTPHAEAVETLGLPIVVKPRVGMNGQGVFVAHTLGELETHLRTVDADEVLMEAFIEGTTANYCAVVGDGAERDMTYRTLQRGADPWSPSVEVACYRDDELTEIGRRLASALPSEGLVNVDAIRDASGRYLVHDVNLRVWGAFFASWNAGFDLSGAYLRWLSDQVRRSIGDREQSVMLFPDYAEAALVSDRKAIGLRVLAAQARDYRRLLGRAYVGREMARWGRSVVLGERTNTGEGRRRLR
jgi:hypothetical protein